jgi:hypothetical protein
LRQLVNLLDAVFDRCLQTLSTTPDLLCYWLQSFRPTDFRPSKLFGILGTEAGQHRYLSYWKRFICFVFRAWRTEHRLREQIYGIRFSSAQELSMSRIWHLLDDQVQQPFERDRTRDPAQGGEGELLWEADHEGGYRSDEESDQEHQREAEEESEEESNLESDIDYDDQNGNENIKHCQEIDQQLRRISDLGEDSTRNRGHDAAAEGLFS